MLTGARRGVSGNGAVTRRARVSSSDRTEFPATVTGPSASDVAEGGQAQEAGVHHRSQHVFAYICLEPPQPLSLRTRQAKTRHFVIFGTNKSHQIGDPRHRRPGVCLYILHDPPPSVHGRVTDPPCASVGSRGISRDWPNACNQIATSRLDNWQVLARQAVVRMTPRQVEHALSLSAGRMVEAVMIWNEPNNLSHWDFELDRGWTAFAEMARLACQAIRAERRRLTRVLGGISPIDAAFMQNRKQQGVLNRVCTIARHLSVVPLRGSAPRSRCQVAEAAWRQIPADRAQLGRQPSRRRARMVRSTDGGARRFRRDAPRRLPALDVCSICAKYLVAALCRWGAVAVRQRHRRGLRRGSH